MRTTLDGPVRRPRRCSPRPTEASTAREADDTTAGSRGLLDLAGRRVDANRARPLVSEPPDVHQPPADPGHPHGQAETDSDQSPEEDLERVLDEHVDAHHRDQEPDTGGEDRA